GVPTFRGLLSNSGLNRWNKRRRSKEFLRQQRMMRTASAQKALYQCIVLQEAKMKDAFATEQPTDEQIEQNFGKREQGVAAFGQARSEEHTSELQSRENLVCRLLLEKKKRNYI